MGLAFANSCLEAGKPRLPKVIGEAGGDIFNAYYIDCDTAFVRAGDTTLVNSATRLIFNAKVPQEKRTIVVEGALIIRGEESRENFVAGTLVEAEFGMVPSRERWNGFRVGPKGSLVLSLVNVSNADTVIRSASDKIILENVRFFNCKRLEVASRTQDLDYKYHRIVSQDFASVPSSHAVQPTPSTSAQSGSHHKKPTTDVSSTTAYWWMGSAVTVATGLGLVWWLQKTESSPEEDSKLSPPVFPTDAKR